MVPSLLVEANPLRSSATTSPEMPVQCKTSPTFQIPTILWTCWLWVVGSGFRRKTSPICQKILPNTDVCWPIWYFNFLFSQAITNTICRRTLLHFFHPNSKLYWKNCIDDESVYKGERHCACFEGFNFCVSLCQGAEWPQQQVTDHFAFYHVVASPYPTRVIWLTSRVTFLRKNVHLLGGIINDKKRDWSHVEQSLRNKLEEQE